MRNIPLLTSLALCLFTVHIAQADQPVRENERMAARQVAVVSINDDHAMPMLFTYAREPEFWLHDIALGKLRVGIMDAGNTVAWMDEADAIEVHNLPTGEGVYAKAVVAGHTVTVEALPTAIGQDTMAFEGGALFIVHCEPAAQIVASYGSVGRVSPITRLLQGWPRREAYLNDPGVEASPIETQSCQPSANGGTLASTTIPLTVGVRIDAPGGVQVKDVDTRLQATTNRPAKRVVLLAAFAESEERANALAGEDADGLEKECRTHFKHLAESAYIKTPEPDLDATFKASLFNLEYGWMRPYGWIETIHHYGTFYSQQMNLAADWIGQQDRSREMLLTHAAHLFPSGQVPQMDPSGRGRIDFGGWNQFYVWGIEHHWRLTGDADFLNKIWEPLNRVVDQTFTEHDPDNDGLLKFGQQIGNQEDYISTPWDGTSPTIAGIEMLRIEAELGKAHGADPEWIKGREEKARWMAEQLRKQLWMPELGRYAFYKDHQGVLRLDGQYHTMIWPVLYDLLTPTEEYLSMRHLGDVMTGPDGEIYTSRNFPYPVIATVGSQAGGQQQPWGTMGWAKLGNGDRAIRSLEWMAPQVIGPSMQGSWPEVNAIDPNTDTAYFTPPTGVYIQSVIESVFGLQLDQPAKQLTISPCMPSDWPKAVLHLPSFDVQVRQSGNRRTIRCRSEEKLQHHYRIAVPPSSQIKAYLNGRAVTPTIDAGVACQFVSIDAGATNKSTLRLTWEPLEMAVQHPDRVAAGGEFDVHYGQLPVQRVVDPCGVLSASQLGQGVAHMTVGKDVAADAKDYGKRGEVTLTRRTVFLEIAAAGQNFWYPVDFAVLPALHFAAAPELKQDGESWALHCPIEQIDQNGTPLQPDQVDAVEVCGHEYKAIEAGDDGLSIPIDANNLLSLTPGLNEVVVHLKDGRKATARFDAAPVMRTLQTARTAAVSEMHPVTLSDDILSPDTQWRDWRPWFAYAHFPWAALQPPLASLATAENLEPEPVPGLIFRNPDRRLAVVDEAAGRPSLTIPVDRAGRTLYLLVIGLVDNHDVFSPIARIRVNTKGGDAHERTLYFPGDFDWFAPPAIVGGFATYGHGWNQNLAWETPTSILNIIKMDLGARQFINAVDIQTIGNYHGVAIAGVTVQDTAAERPDAR